MRSNYQMEDEPRKYAVVADSLDMMIACGLWNLHIVVKSYYLMN